MPVIRQQRTEFLRPAQVNRMDTGAADYAQAISRNADQLAGIAFQRAAQKAEEVGTERALGTAQSAILTINPETGRPEAFDSFTGMGEIANQAFKRIVDNRFRTEIDADLRQKSAEFASQNPDPEAYAQAFSNYAGGLVENADPLYREFVMTTSTDYLEKTKLNLMERARARARAENQRFLATRLEDLGGQIEAAALANDFEAVDALTAEAEALAADGLASNLIDPTQAEQYAKALQTTAGGSIAGIMATELSKIDQMDARQFFITNGEQGSLPDTEAGRRIRELMTVENRFEIASQFDDFRNQENARRGVLMEEFSKSFDRAVRSYEASQQAQLDASIREATIGNEFIGQPEVARYGQLVAQYNQGLADPYAEQDRMLALRDAIESTPDRIAQEVILAERKALDLYGGGAIGDEKFNSLRSNARRSGLQNIVAVALSQNPQDREFLQTAITSPTSEAYDRLSPMGKAAARAARQFYKADGDSDALSGFMKMSDNEYLDTIDRNQIEFGIISSLDQAVGRVENGVASEEDFLLIQQAINSEDAVRLLSADQRAGYLADTKAGLAAVRMASLVSNVDSETGEAIQDVFNNRGDENRINAIGELGPVVQEIMGEIPEGKRDIVSTALDRSLNDVIEAEDKLAAEDAAMQLEMNIVNGLAPQNADNAEVLQDVLIRDFGLDLQNPTTWNTPQVQQQIIQSGFMPSFMQDALNKMARGGTGIKNADALMNAYVSLRDYQAPVQTPSGRQVIVSADVVSSLSAKDRAVLDAAYEVSRQVEGAPINTLLENFNEIFRDNDRMLQNIRANLGDEYEDVGQFLASIDLEGYKVSFENRPDLIQEYTNYANYFLATMAGNPEAVRKAVVGSIESRFVRSDYVMDFGMTPDAGRIGAISEFSPKRFEKTNPQLVGAEDYVYQFFLDELRRFDPDAMAAQIPIGTPSARADDGYMIQVQPQSRWPDSVIYALVKEQDGIFVPAIFTDAKGDPYIPAFDSSTDFEGLVQKNKQAAEEVEQTRELPMSDRFEDAVNEPTPIQKFFGD